MIDRWRNTCRIVWLITSAGDSSPQIKSELSVCRFGSHSEIPPPPNCRNPFQHVCLINQESEEALNSAGPRKDPLEAEKFCISSTNDLYVTSDTCCCVWGGSNHLTSQMISLADSWSVCLPTCLTTVCINLPPRSSLLLLLRRRASAAQSGLSGELHADNSLSVSVWVSIDGEGGREDYCSPKWLLFRGLLLQAAYLEPITSVTKVQRGERVSLRPALRLPSQVYKLWFPWRENAEWKKERKKDPRGAASRVRLKTS